MLTFLFKEQAGVKMMMIQDSQDVSNQPKPLRIIGDPDKVEGAKRLINDIINGGREAGDRPFDGGAATARGEVGLLNIIVNFTANSLFQVVVPRTSVGMIIGKGGETIKRLGMETGTKIQFKPDGTVYSSVAGRIYNYEIQMTRIHLTELPSSLEPVNRSTRLLN